MNIIIRRFQFLNLAGGVNASIHLKALKGKCFRLWQIPMVLTLMAAVGPRPLASYATCMSDIESLNIHHKRTLQELDLGVKGVDSRMIRPGSMRLKEVQVDGPFSIGRGSAKDIGKVSYNTEGKEMIRSYSGSSDFKIGAIVTSRGAKLYMSGERDEFIRDALKFIATHDVKGIDRKEFDAGSGECVDGNGGCISLYSGSSSRLAHVSRVEAIFTSESIQEDATIKALGDKVLAKSFAVSDLSLCRWIRQLSKSILLTKWTGRLPPVESRNDVDRPRISVHSVV